MRTIVALASARGKAGVSVIRVSGPSAWEICESLAGGVPKTREASLRFLRDKEGGIIDQALVLTFEKGRSFSGEESVEFHVHGSPAVIQSVLSSCLEHSGVRAALPGEFTRRAYESGNLSTVQVEGLADLIEADTERQRKLAMRLLRGESQTVAAAWRKQLLQALSLLEAGIDFSDEELPPDLSPAILSLLEETLEGIRTQLSRRVVSERIRDGYDVAIVGEVNLGKSTLLNALAGREAALTSEHAGTTRDVIEVRMDIEGYAVSLIDTAGLRETEDPVERLGIERGAGRAREADLRIYLKKTPDEIIEQQSENDIVVLAKCDLFGLPGISGKTGEGLDELVGMIAKRLERMGSSSAIFSRERHFQSLELARLALEDAKGLLDIPHRQEELAAAAVREAVTHLDSLIGRIDVEEVLGEIFSSFCIGK